MAAASPRLDPAFVLAGGVSSVAHPHGFYGVPHAGPYYAAGLLAAPAGPPYAYASSQQLQQQLQQQQPPQVRVSGMNL